jgi:hypothetical protein
MRNTRQPPTGLAVIVDAYSTGSCLPKEFGHFGIKCVHVQSSPDIPADFLAAFRPGDFQKHFVIGAPSGVDDIAADLKRLVPIMCVIAGTETGVETAERLARLLHVPGNDPRTSRLRRDKYEMHERLREGGLSALRQARCVTVGDALDWAGALQSWPVVVKPSASAGADGVRFCDDMAEVAVAVDAILGKRNKLGEINEAAVLQEKIAGQQFIVNAVSMDGRHYISEIWKDDKIAVPGASLICEREILLAPDDDLARVLKRYTTACLDALGIREGPSHTELFQTEDGELLLIETAARMQGTIDHEAVIDATAHSHVTLTVLRHADPGAFSELLGMSYSRRKHLHCVTLSSSSSGTLKENRCHERLSTLKSFRSLIHAPEPGETVARTIDLFTNAGITYLAAESEQVLEQEYTLIRFWEANGELFVFE